MPASPVSVYADAYAGVLITDFPFLFFAFTSGPSSVKRGISERFRSPRCVYAHEFGFLACVYIFLGAAWHGYISLPATVVLA